MNTSQLKLCSLCNDSNVT